jgi:hypothetical protein
VNHHPCICLPFLVLLSCFPNKSKVITDSFYPSDSLYQLLMELAQSRGGLLSAQSPSNLAAKSSVEPDSESLSALACSCLLSLVIACGDSGKLLTAIAAMLMFSARLAKQEIKVCTPSFGSFLLCFLSVILIVNMVCINIFPVNLCGVAFTFCIEFS